MLVVAASADEDRLAVERGGNLYRIYCQTCHGQHGRGDGPTAEVLKVRPPDLTRLSSRNDAEFPEEAVRTTIDGRDNLPASGSFIMVCNHTSHLDTLCMLCAVPLRKIHRTFPGLSVDADVCDLVAPLAGGCLDGGKAGQLQDPRAR